MGEWEKRHLCYIKMCAFSLDNFLGDYLWFMRYTLTTKINRILVTFARVPFLHTSSPIILNIKRMPTWLPSVSTTVPVPSRKPVFFHKDWTPSKYENKEQNSEGPNNNGNNPMDKRHTSSLTQDPCVIRPPKMAVLLLSIHPLLGQCLLHLHLLTWLTFLYAWPRAQLMTALALHNNPPQCLSKGQGGHEPLLLFMMTNDPPWQQLPL